MVPHRPFRRHQRQRFDRRRQRERPRSPSSSIPAATASRSSSDTSDESITICLNAGTYYAVVYSDTTPPLRNTYTLTYAATSATCPPATCVDDAYEPDDDAADANYVDLSDVADTGPFMEDHQICADNPDWYEVDLSAGDTIYASMAFTQNYDQEDLDFHFYDGATDLTPCDDTTPCSDAFGQSGSSNESFSRTVTHDGAYYVVVEGYNGAQNAYSICISNEAGDCPVYAK